MLWSKSLSNFKKNLNYSSRNTINCLRLLCSNLVYEVNLRRTQIVAKKGREILIRENLKNLEQIKNQIQQQLLHYQ